jgi:hypothetical protein
MIFHAAGWCIPLVGLVNLPRLMRIVRRVTVREAFGSGGAFFLGSTLFYLHYLFFMIPRRGPLKDLDLFFVSYLVITYGLARLLTGTSPTDTDSRSREALFWGSLTGGAIVVAPLVFR